MKEKYHVRHPDDRGIDEVLFCATLPSTHDDALVSAFLRLGLRERYKTSGLSGDEWRFSTMLQLRESPVKPWVDTSSGYRDLQAHAAFLYGELYGDFIEGGKHEWLYRRRVHGIAFAWKGQPVWCASYDGEATDLLVACGHLPGALIQAGENGYPTEGLKRLCCQPGCAAPFVSVYRRRKDYCGSCGREGDLYGGRLRGFCERHLRRGDCALDDADANYEVVSGPGPNGHEPDPAVVRESGFMRVQVPPDDGGSP